MEYAGIAKSSVSRAVKAASEARLRELMERSFHECDIVAVYIDGVEVAGHHVLAAVGLDDDGQKHLLGLVRGQFRISDQSAVDACATGVVPISSRHL